MKITFIGTGYVGLVSAIMMAYIGHEVTSIDIDKEKIASLKNSIIPIYEPKLEEYLKIAKEQNRIKFSTEYDDKIFASDAIFVCVGTPELPSGEANLEYIYNSIDCLINFLHEKSVIIIKSTVPPSTCKKIDSYLKAKNLNCHIVSNPEFLREGSAIEDFLNPDRVIIGVESAHAKSIIAKIYESFSLRNIPILYTDLASSELIKYVSNCFLATKIAFINEIANLSEKIGTNIEDVSLGTGLDRRIGIEFLKAGPGFGGSCFPKDILALKDLAKKNDVNINILDAVIIANNKRPFDMADKILKILEANNIKDPKITFLGLSFKSGTDDLRTSPSLEIIKILQKKEMNIIGYDPISMKYARKFIDNLECADSYLEACNNSDAVIITTEWEEFKFLDFQAIYKKMNSKIIIDLRNILDRDSIVKKGFKYFSIGRKDE